MNTQALIYPVDGHEFQPALTLDSAFRHPKERAGSPVSYWWKQMLKPGVKARDRKTGIVEEISKGRIQTIALCYSRAKAAGFEPPLPLGSHKVDAAPNAGWLVDVEVKPDGSLWGLHQFIGTEDEGRRLAASYKSSISTVKNYRDQNGTTYEELPDHNALVSNPFLTDLNDFVPAIAASRGAAITVVELEPAAPTPKEVHMDFANLRKRLGAANDVPDEKLIDLADARLGELETAKQGEAAKVAALTTEKLQLSRDLDAKGLELSRATSPTPPSAEQMYFLGQTLALKRDAAVAKVGPVAVNKACERYLGVETFDTGGLTLSREPAADDAKRAEGMKRLIDYCDLALHAVPVPKTGEHSGVQFSRHAVEPDDKDKLAEARRKELLSLTPLGQTLLAH